MATGKKSEGAAPLASGMDPEAGIWILSTVVVVVFLAASGQLPLNELYPVLWEP